MKILFSLFLVLNFNSFSQSSKVYSLVRPTAGGSIQLVEFDLVNNTQYSVKTYLSSELDDFNPDAVSFNNSNHQLITAAYTAGGDQQIISIDVTDGTILSRYQVTGYEVSCIEFSNSFAYSIVTPIAAGNLKLVKFNLIDSSETTIHTYNQTELSGYNPEVVSFDHLNKRILTIAEDASGNEQIIAVDITDGSIDEVYVNAEGVFLLERLGNKIYSLVYPAGGGNLSLVEIDMLSNSESTIITYLPAILEDYAWGSTFDFEHNRLIVLGENDQNVNMVMAINISNGSVDYSYTPQNINIFALEADCQLSLGIENSEVENESQVNIFPNPASDNITIETSLKYTSLSVYNSIGKEIYNENFSTETINTGDYSSGIYFIKIAVENDIIVKKFIIQ